MGGNKEKGANKESKDVELLLKLCAYKYNVKLINGELKIENYKGKINQLLDDFSEKVLNFTDEIAEYKSSLEKFINCVEDISTNNRESLWPCLFVAAERENFDVVITKDLCNDIIHSKKYCEANTSGTSSKADIEARLGCVYEQIRKLSK